MQRTLNLVTPLLFLILTLFASFRRAVRRNSLMSLICLGYVQREGTVRRRRRGRTSRIRLTICKGCQAGEGEGASSLYL